MTTQTKSARRKKSGSRKKTKQVEVICLTYGEPPELTFKAQYEYSHSILNRLTRRVAPIPKFVTPLLAARRGLIRKRDFTEIGYHSPLEEITARQVAKIQKFLEEKRPGIKFNVRAVCEFRPPYLWDVLERLKTNPPDELIIVPLYVAESDFTSGVSRKDLSDFHKRHNGDHPFPEPRYLRGFGFEERMGKVFADFVWECVQNAGWDEAKCKESVLILGAHGTLQFPPVGINSGLKETLNFYGLIRKHLKDRFRTVRIGWLNHDIGGQWTWPEVADSARQSQEAGIDKVVYFPFGFMADNAESQLEGKNMLEEFEWDDLLYLPCPNDYPPFCELLAEMVIERLETGRGEPWIRVEKGDQSLVQKERPVKPGKPGVFSFESRGLATFAGGLWLLVGFMLLYRGADMAVTLPPVTMIFVSAIALALGIYKAEAILNKMARKNLIRLRRLPQPSGLWRMYSIPTWVIIFFFMALGIAIRVSALPIGLKAAILIAVGVALLMGGWQYFWKLEMARPVTPPLERVQRMT